MDRYPLEYGWDEAANSPNSETQIAQAPQGGLDNELSAYQRYPADLQRELPNPLDERAQDPLRVEFRLRKPAKADGYIVQKMTHTPPEGPSHTYWEKWDVRKGETRTTGYPVVDDTFGNLEGGTPPGTKIQAEARFYEGLALPDDRMSQFKPYSVPEAGRLPATEIDPDLPTANATAPLVRAWQSPSQ